MRKERKLSVEEKETGPSSVPKTVLDQLAIMVLDHYREFLFAKEYRTEARMNTEDEEYIMWFETHQFRFFATEKDKVIRSVYKLTKKKVIRFDDLNYGADMDLIEPEENSQEMMNPSALPKQDKESDAV